MISTASIKGFSTNRRQVLQQITKLRHDLEDLTDYLDLLEARARNFGKRRLSTAEVKQRLGLK